MKTFVIILISVLCMMGCSAIFPMKNLSSLQPNAGLICPNSDTICLQGTTCCPTDCGSYYCCPHMGGVCCPDNRRCCHPGSKCNPKNLTCDPLEIENPTNYH